MAFRLKNILTSNKQPIPRSRLIRLAIFIIPVSIVLSQCLDLKQKEDPRGKTYAGAESCMSCHKDIYSSYLHTAHFHASQPANEHTISGSFADGHNLFAFSTGTKVVMSKTDEGFFQTAYEGGHAIQTERFDITFGGVKGETYAYWKKNELFQLPISYASNVHEWINSPGYTYDEPYFSRGIITACLDCHMSFAKQETPDIPGYFNNNEGFNKDSMVYSVDCERCHGPAAEHVKFHLDNPTEKKAKFIVAFKSLSREQKINMCAQCHSGTGNPILAKPTFAFKPNDSVAHYNTVNAKIDTDYKHVDVHGNQKALLASSKCFINSNMDCSTCHNTHVSDRDNPVLYAIKCMNCHTNGNHNTCKLSGQLNADMLKKNCVSCHMPALPSKVIIAGLANAMVHTHHIAVYPEETQKILTYLKIKAR